MFCVSVIMLLVWDVCFQNERWVSWVFYSRLGEVIAHLGWFVQEFHLFGVVFLPLNPLKEVFGRPFVSRIVVRMTLPCAPMDMKIGVGEGDFRWRWTVDFRDANVCIPGCKRLQPRLHISASRAESGIFGFVNICISVHNKHKMRHWMSARSVITVCKGWCMGFWGRF